MVEVSIAVDQPVTKWAPEYYVDEVCAQPRPTPAAWLVKLADGADALAGEKLFWDGEPIPIQHGEVIQFYSYTDYGSAALTLDQDGNWKIDRTMPDGCTQCCVMNGWQEQTVDADIEGMARLLARAGAEPGIYPVSFSCWDGPFAFEFDGNAKTFKRVGSA